MKPDAKRAPAARGVPFLEARALQCRWPLWADDAPRGDADRRVCGAPTDGRSYCAHHAARAYVPLAPSKLDTRFTGQARSPSPAADADPAPLTEVFENGGDA